MRSQINDALIRISGLANIDEAKPILELADQYELPVQMDRRTESPTLTVDIDLRGKSMRLDQMAIFIGLIEKVKGTEPHTFGRELADNVDRLAGEYGI